MKRALMNPFAVLPPLCSVPEKIGPVATILSSFGSPFAVARTLATIYHLSNGREGWDLLTSTSARELSNFGAPILSLKQRYRKAKTFIKAACRIWIVGNQATLSAIDKAGYLRTLAKTNIPACATSCFR
ncbi:LLM class flavin-dependent oxidoreductase [Enterobacteriaceae bacterium RIT697]|nr:LLM class flavin-dependent oxidoreductase [Enterobacteriaceae bacterium RIT697]